MYLYLVLSDNLSDNEVESTTKDSYKLMNGVWAVQSEHNTPADLSNALGINVRNDGVVFRISSRYGWANSAFWDKLEVWEQQR